MAKGGGRKPSEKQMSPAQGSGGGKFGSRTLIGVTPALSAEDAERAAEAFVPLWQLDDAPFAAGAKLGEDDLRSLAGPLTAPLALQHAPPPVIRAATSAAGSTDSSVDPRHELATRATVKMTPVPAALHQPSPAHPTEPELPVGDRRRARTRAPGSACLGRSHLGATDLPHSRSPHSRPPSRRRRRGRRIRQPGERLRSRRPSRCRGWSPSRRARRRPRSMPCLEVGRRCSSGSAGPAW